MSRTLLISDLHLSGERPQINERFFRFLRDVAAHASALYVLGDLFEYWIGDDELDAADGDPLGREVAEGFRTLAQAGTSVSLMHGNRDFLLGPRFCERAAAHLLDDPCRLTLEGTPTLLMHGDTLCTDDLDYQAWRRIARSAAWQQTFLAKPLAERHAQTRALRAKSEAVTKAKRAEIMDVNAGAVEQAFRSHGVQRIIHGHTHRPAQHRHGPGERWVLPDWYERGGYLELGGGAPQLIVF